MQITDIFHNINHINLDTKTRKNLDKIIDILWLPNQNNEDNKELAKNLIDLYTIYSKHRQTDYGKNAKQLFNAITERRAKNDKFDCKTELEYIALFEDGRDKANSYFIKE